MNENHKRRGLAHSKFLATVAICALFLGSGQLQATEASSDSHGVLEQMQTTKVTVTVEDQLGPVVGANVMEKGTTNGAITDLNGQVNLEVSKGAVLQISFVGYVPQEVKVTGSVLKVILKEDTALLDEVVVVGYGTQKRANLTGAVSTVDVGKTLEARPQGDISKALQGVVPGLTILNSSGELAATPTITIRGTGTLSNSATSNPLIIVDGVQMDDLSILNPDDIESISVLKDAASSSIYGARAAFGVILVTTKSAQKKDKVTINYSNNFSWSTPTMLPDFPDVATQARALRAANERQGVANELFGMYLDDEFINAAEAWKKRHGGKAGYREMVEGDDFYISDSGTPVYVADWDVVGIMFQNWKPAQKHNVSIQGTSGKTSYYLSFGYNKDEGVLNFNPDKLKRYNVTMNVQSDITKWLTVGGRFSYNDRNYTKPNTRRYTYQYMWRWGSFFGPYGYYKGVDMRNDIAYLKQAGDAVLDNTYTRIGGFAKAKLLKGLTLNADYTVSIQNRDYLEEGLPVYCWNSWGGQLNSPAYASSQSASYILQQSNKNQSYALNVYANYEFSLAKDHNFNIMVGANAEEGTRRMHYSKRTGLLDSTLPEFDLATGTQTVDGSHSEWGTAGWFGRINYDWKGIWLVELNGRYDGSSSFPASDRWAFFPSGSMGYRFSEEAYFEPLKKIVNNGKFRASFGEIGNEAVGSNMFISTIGAQTVNWLDSGGTKVTGYGLPSLVSSTLKWERIQTVDLGLDLAFLNNDLNVSFDWYQRTTKDMLAPAKTMPQVLGASAPKVNAGELRTRGWELSIDYRHTFQDLDNLSVYGNFSIGDFKTEITKWDNDSKLLNSNYSGKNYGDIWGFETEGIFKDDADVQNHADQSALQKGSFVYGPGDIKFKDLNGDGKIDGGSGTADDHGDLKVIGNTLPRYQYSFRLGGSWKGFDIDMFFQGVGKRDIWSTGAFVIPMSRGADAIYENQTDYWTKENQNVNAFYPSMWAGNASQGTISVINAGSNNFYPQSRYLIDASYLRFKNLTIGYTLPKQLTKKVYLEKVRVYFSADNICELINNSYAPVDPEINATENGSFSNGTWGRIDPMYRTVSFGLQATF
ncbi:MAG: TonB-dependent receptor [Bacteroides sp.]|nr:TonB-dependent receptor [Bacteroides sp.]